MNEHETDPQRHETPAQEPSHRPADASFESGSPERGLSEPTAAHPTVQQPPVQQPVQQPPPASPWQAPHPQAPHGAPQHPGHPQDAGYGYPQQSAPRAYPSAHPQPGTYPQPGGYPQPDSGGYPQGDQQSHPAWAAPVDTRTRQPGSGRGRKIFVAGAAAVLIALAGGGVGAATVLAMDDGNDGTTLQTSNSSVTRMVDRSSLAQIAAAVQDGVVSITTGSGEGSGVVLSADGYVLTNNHVVASAQGGTVDVVFADGKKASGTIVGTDPRTDLAVVKAADVSGLSAVKFGDSAKMQVGDTVLALGSPLGLQGSVTSGIISAKDRTIRSGGQDEQAPQNPFGGEQPQQQQQGTTSMSGLLQTDAPINPGNSGGALVNTNGELIGINTAIATGGSGTGNIGLGFAIPSNKAKLVADDLIAGRKVSHPALGVSVTESDSSGALVRTVTPDSAAAKAGVQQGDIITTVNGKPINDSDDLVAVVQAGKVGDQVTIVFTRGGAQRTVTATLAEAG